MAKEPTAPRFQAGEPWLTGERLARVERLAAWRRLFEGRHREHFYLGNRTQHAFKEVGPNAGRVLYIADTLPGQAVLKHADLLFGEELAVEPAEGADDAPALAAAIERIVRQSRLHPALFEAAVTSGWAGRAYWQLVVEAGAVRAEHVEPERVFPRYAPGGGRLAGATILYPLTIGETRYLRVIDHEPGRIVQELWELDGGERIVRQAALDRIGGAEPVQETGLPGLAIVEVENYAMAGRGASDFDGAESLIDEVNNRLTQISRVLDQHGDPAVQALESLFDEHGNLKIAGRAVAVESLKDGDAVRYVTWNAQLEHAAVQLDRAMRAFLRHVEVAPSLVGLGDAGTSADTWKKFKLQAATTLARVNRKRLFLAPAIEELFAGAFALENRFALGVAYRTGPVSLTFSNGLPVDDAELSQIVTTYRREGLMSERMALTWMHGSQRIVEEEIQRLAEEREAALPTSLRDGGLDLAGRE